MTSEFDLAEAMWLRKMRKQRQVKTISGVPPLTFKAKGSNLKDYRIYGNTVGGESVGDRAGNLFDDTFIHRSVIGEEVSDDELYRRSIVVDISNFNNGDKITFSRETGVGSALQMYQVSSPLKGGRLLNTNTISGNSKTLLATITLDNISGYPYLMIFLNGSTKPIADEELLASKIMVNVGKTPLPYEPYGYRVPVTVANGTDTVTTNIYIPEQLKMVGDEAEYIDYAEQKQHRVRKNLLPNPATSQTISGVTFTVNEDGRVTCNGTASAITYFNLNENFNSTLYAGMKASFYQSEQQPNVNTFMIRISKANRVSTQDFTMNDQVIIDNGDSLLLTIRINSGYTCNNLTFYPMICKADIEDDTYEPYIENADLDITLPALPTLPGTNTLTVGTEVQPSSVEIKGRIKAAGGD